MSDMAHAVCILGMHRSGTSLLASLLDRLGVYFGPVDDFLAPNFANPAGYWELEAIVQTHDAIFEELSRSWDTVFPLPEGWYREPRIRPHRERLEEVVARTFSEHDVFGWKDPRTCLTLPLWKEILESLEIPVQYVMVFRNPLDVARSLAERDGFETVGGLGLWLHYNLRMLTETRGLARIAVRYEDLLDPKGEEVKRLSEALSLGAPEAGESALSAIDPELRHHRSTDAELAELAPALVVSLHEQIQRALDEKTAWCELDDAADELFRDFTYYETLFRHDSREASKRSRRSAAEVERLEARIERLAAEHEQERQRATTLDERLHRSADAIARLEREVVSQRRLVEELRRQLEELAGLESELAAHRSHVEHLRGQLLEADEQTRLLAAELAKIHGSRLWRNADRYWRLRRWIGLDS